MQPRTKYPRTFHLPFSPGKSADDKIIESYDAFIGKEVVITEKLDGQNCTMYNDYIHARSIDGRYHPSQDWVKQFHSIIRHSIPLGDRICGENMYAQHSIPYDDLSSYFYGFSYWTNDLCWDWDNTIAVFNELSICYPSIMYRGIFDINKIHELADSINTDIQEGFVVRLTDSFHISEFSNKVAKWVRDSHVQTDEHWSLKPIIPNKMRI